MNTTYLMHHISYHLHTIVKQFTIQGRFMKQICERPDFHDNIINTPEFVQFLLHSRSNEMPVIATDHLFHVYSAITTPKYIFVIGPLQLENSIHFKYQLPNPIDYDENWFHSIPICDLNSLVQDILLIHNLFHKSIIKPNDILTHNFVDIQVVQSIQKHFSNILFQNQELGRMHNPYDQEVREFTSIRNGDLEQLEKSWSEDFIGDYGVLAKDKLRSMKNICIVVIALASRAAIDGGVSPEIAYSLSDSYICKIEEITNIQTLTYVCHQAEYEYTKMVYELKEPIGNKKKKKIQSPRVSQCKDYIFKHLHEKICISDIAYTLKTNTNYLAELFRESEGITIGEFIICEKINLAKNLLIYSQYSYIEIATFLGFCSQSHFGKQFKKITTFTPKQYREAYGVKEFIEDSTK